MANEFARQLRKRETVDERNLWRELRALRLQGYHFRRQAPLEGFVVDFACLAHRLVIEVDGIGHDTPDQRAADTARDAHLRWRGYSVLRFSNGDVRHDRDGVMLRVLATLGCVDWDE